VTSALTVYGCTAALSAILCVLLVRVKGRLRIVDVPNERSSHTVPKPRTGGIAMLVAIAGGLALWTWLGGPPAESSQNDTILAAGALAFFMLGFVDDVKRLPASARIVAQVAIAAAVAWSGVRIEVVELPALPRWLLAEPVAVTLTTIWLVGVVNAFNFMDGLDGIAAGEAIVVGLLYAAVGDATWGLVFSAAALGFWLLNREPSRLFMGDGGSYLLGFLLGATPIVISGGGERTPFVVFVLFLATFLADTTVTLARRVARREKWWTAHRSHHYQRLAQRSFRHSRVAAINVGLTALLGLGGVLYERTPWAVQAAILVAAALMLGVLLTWVGRLERGEPILAVRRLAVIAADLFVVAAAFVLAYMLRFEFRLEYVYLPRLLKSIPYVLAVYFAASHALGLYRGVSRYSSFADLRNITAAVAAAGVAVAAAVMFVYQGYFPRTILIMHPLLAFLGIGGVRFGVRVVKQLGWTRLPSGPVRRVLVVGAGDLAENLLRQMSRAVSVRYQVVGLVDDDPAKWGLYMHGRPILGGLVSVAAILERQAIDEVAIAVESQRGDVVRSVVESMRDLPVKPELKIAPNLNEMLRTPGDGLSVRKVNPADLLNRDVVHLDEARIAASFRGAIVLVTGAGGTIGGELCRQVLRYAPSKLVLLESHATSLFYQESELREIAKGAELAAVLGDVRDEATVERVFAAHRPHFVLHAAAHKHVHQLEHNIAEGIGNNVIGTRRVAAAAHRFGAKAFLLVSTDKAVRPTSVMGATKRAAEVVVQRFAQTSSTRFVAVRFGNVVGSSGSVLKIFEDQIAKGGPLTITDPRATRYFMTVEEAVGLILQAVSIANGGEIFVLKMGTPVRIADMARNLLLLSGLEPGKDIEIRVIGLRQGEKLDEELVEAGSETIASEHPDITVLQKVNGVPKDLDRHLEELERLARGADTKGMLHKLAELVPTFQPTPALPPESEAPPPSQVVSKGPGVGLIPSPTGSTS
jgi:FlaA1/EpsC-like NDP-sugar epimerase/UDP-N-acetylmuramyl pentapeptide phosphotransferase/UDP-N-acetylglucosamine-1-phosphate transferase